MEDKGQKKVNLNSDNTLSHKPYQWREPKAHSLLTSEMLLKGWEGKLSRTLIIVASIELLFYFLLKPLPLKDMGLNLDRAFLILFLFALIFSTFVYFIYPYLIRFNRKKYKVYVKGIKIDSFLGSRTYLWKHVRKCQPIEKHPRLEGIICIYFHTKQSSYPRALVFEASQNDLAKKIHNTIKDKVSNHIEMPIKG